MSPPIAPDHFRVIAARVPGVTADEIEMSVAGYDHIVYFVRRRLTFRFPRVPRRINPARKRFLDVFAAVSPIPVPTGDIECDGRTGGDYEVNRYLPGVPLEPALAGAFTAEQRRRVAGELGAFLSALHQFPLAAARALGVDELDPAEFGAYVAEHPAAYPYYRQLVFPLLTAAQRRWVERLFGGYLAQVNAQPFSVRVTHADLWSYHILVDPEQARLAGVLDYWPRIADPASDFKPFEHYGAEFVAAVFAQYTPPRDEAFELRRLYYTGHDEVAELARAISRRDPAQIAARHASLAKYIAEHSNGMDV